METKVLPPQNLATQPALGALVDRIVWSASSAAGRSRSVVINDIPADLEVKADSSILSSVIANLLYTILRHTKNSCIHISAKRYQDIILLHMKDSNGFSTGSISSSLLQMKPMAQRIGGYLDISGLRRQETTIAFSFSNLQTS